MAAKQPKYTYQLKITLKGAKPPIWRRVLVPSDIRLDRLHSMIQIAMGWFNCHLHQFAAFGRYFGAADSGLGADLDIDDETKIKLHDLLRSEKDSIVYEYDFGDSWEHKATLEKILAYDKRRSCRSASRAIAPARLRTAGAYGDTTGCWRSWPTPLIPSMTRCWSGSAEILTRRHSTFVQ